MGSSAGGGDGQEAHWSSRQDCEAGWAGATGDTGQCHGYSSSGGKSGGEMIRGHAPRESGRVSAPPPVHGPAVTQMHNAGAARRDWRSSCMAACIHVQCMVDR